MNAPPLETFSFRMFDLYRRVVEVLKLEPELLADFQTGSPSKASCQVMIKKVFRYNQTEEKKEAVINYLIKNAKTMANHAINVPPNWNNAVQYTNTCIALIKKYLRNNRINSKNIDLFDPNVLATNIASTIYSTPKEKQIEAITEYLKYDFRNPTKTIIITMLPKKIKAELKTADVEQNLNMTVSTTFNESSMSTQEKEIELIDLESSSPEEKVEIPYHFLMTKDMTDAHEKSLEMKDRLELEKILQTDDVVISPADLLTAEDKTPNGSTAALIESTNKSNLNGVLENGYQYELKDYVKSLIDEPVKNHQEKDMSIIANEEPMIEPQNHDKENIQKCNNSLDLKRKSFVLNDNDNNVGAKRFSRDTTLSPVEKDTAETANCSEVDKTIDFAMAKIQALNTPDSSIIDDSYLNGSKVDSDEKLVKKVRKRKTNSNNRKVLNAAMLKSDDSQKQMTLRSSTPKKYSEIKHESPKSLSPTSPKRGSANSVQKKRIPNTILLKKKQANLQTQESLSLALPKKIIQNSDLAIITPAQLKKLDQEKSLAENDIKYMSVLGMSYSEVLQMVEKIISFCELNNEISLEEFLVLRRIRDKMHWRSLKETKKLV